MFTGLVDDVGIITQVADTPAGRELRIATRYSDIVDGESIAVNGACLTVRDHGINDAATSWFAVAAIETTLERTNVASWREGKRVNLERALRVGDRLGGHMVLGHVDALGTVRRTAAAGDAWLIDVELPESLRPLVVDKGSIAIDGVSLTVNELLPFGVQLSIIEYTRHHTALGDITEGDRVHVEADVLAKHVERLVTSYMGNTGAVERHASDNPTNQLRVHEHV